MDAADRMRAALGEAVLGASPGLTSADRLCSACVDLLDVDGAAVSLIHGDTTRGTFGSSGELSRRLDELQFTFGEGPCLDSVRSARAVLVPDFLDAREQRWPAYAAAVLDAGVRAVFALPVSVAANRVGALDLFRRTPGPLTDDALTGGLLAAELAALPLLDLMSELDGAPAAGQGEGGGWPELASLERVEVYQATGMIMGHLEVTPAEALVRLRAHAIGHDLTASEVAWSIVERRLVLEADDAWRSPEGSP